VDYYSLKKVSDVEMNMNVSDNTLNFNNITNSLNREEDSDDENMNDPLNASKIKN